MKLYVAGLTFDCTRPAPLAHFRWKLPQRSAVDNAQVELAIQRRVMVRQYQFVPSKQPVLESPALLFPFDLE